MKTYAIAGLALLALSLSSTAGAGPFQFRQDSFYCQSDGYYYGDALPAQFEIWELGSRIVQTAPASFRLEFSLWADLPETGAYAVDSSDTLQLLSPGDLWITVGSRNPFSATPGVTRHAVALIDRNDQNHPDDYDPNFGGNVARQKYPGEVWPQITQGNLYTNAQFATATFEEYQLYIKQQTPPPGLSEYWYSPDDQDGNDSLNSYMTLIKGFDQEITGHSAVTWTLEQYWYWDTDLDDWALQDAWRVTGYVDMDQIGLTPSTYYSIFVSSECGNDGAWQFWPPISEPATLSLLAAGLAAARRRRRR